MACRERPDDGLAPRRADASATDAVVVASQDTNFSRSSTIRGENSGRARAVAIDTEAEGAAVIGFGQWKQWQADHSSAAVD